MGFLLGGLFFLVVLIALGYLFVNTDPKTLARAVRIIGATIAVLIGLLFAFRGQLGMTAAALALAYAVATGGRLSPFGRFRTPSGGHTSRVRSAALEMELDHDSGAMRGRILAGRFEGQNLDDLDEAGLQQFAAEISNDDESLALLETYLDRRFPGWREHVDPDDRPGQGRAPQSGTMTDEEAYQILGVAPGASESDIVAAHRRLMGRVHPDRGGSTFLAAKINEAKDRLLGKHGSTRTRN